MTTPEGGTERASRGRAAGDTLGLGTRRPAVWVGDLRGGQNTAGEQRNERGVEA